MTYNFTTALQRRETSRKRQHMSATNKYKKHIFRYLDMPIITEGNRNDNFYDWNCIIYRKFNLSF